MPAALPPPSVEVAEGETLRRVHRHTRPAMWFGARDGGWRWDDPDHTYGVLYLGRTLDAALAETLLRSPEEKTVKREDIVVRREALFRVEKTLRLADLHGAGLSYWGRELADVVSRDYTVPQALSARIHNETQLDGIEYRSRFNSDGMCVALFERAADKIRELVSEIPLNEDAVRSFLARHGKTIGRVSGPSVAPP